MRTSQPQQHPQRIQALAAALLLAILLPGCVATRQARYVYQDGEFGVVGIPENTNRWPRRYQDQAEALMARHFPEGHEIVRAEEVEEGSRTLEIKGTGTAEIAPSLPSEILSLAKLGRTMSRSQSDQIKIRECRIVYRRAARPAMLSTFADDTAPADTDEPSRFADRPTLTPDPYLDPNAPGRLAAARASQAAATERLAAQPSDDTPPKPPAPSSPPPRTDGQAKLAAGAASPSPSP